ncbi:DUF4435 domain-containing protein [Vibrio crassostreae]|uniref:DUF4435 domain-containing protein n=1 Tax=Vibrio crassostreae TaxID=246167 RepID=UPI000F46A8B0|nr:DUF4435 domain-containing protein [Vibrio crassostreae]MEC7306933.1 DUF4435 domain-containing protein [Vibrio crassostreae]CAK2203563.1 DUF4435 domain-containing protein [Vibrio crassostreae]CAK2241352.1 DUF4435 domain-containing protein [Vibrio crassostreae]CAK2830172.1 DUF4435 domain-containing protein [Vibrio crassostreae]CAK3026066.1 DUF4435 domain-containing protein [Vibrio crassostreae]
MAYKENQQIPSYKNSYMSSYGLLYRPLQDIEIYVEDKDSEVFYTQLFSRMLEGHAKIKKIIPLGCRTSVIEGAKKHGNDSAKVFVIDGDLYWTSQTYVNDIERLFVHSFYCIENTLFCADAASKIIQESLGNLTFEQAKTKLNWDEWVDDISPILNRLFVIFSVVFKLKPQLKTTSRGFSSIITSKKGSLPKIDIEKANSIYNELYNELLKDYSQDVIDTEIESVLIFSEKYKLEIISGKDFLIPLLGFKITEACGVKLSVESRNFRLASHCNLDILSPLKDFILKTLKSYKSTPAM